MRCKESPICHCESNDLTVHKHTECHLTTSNIDYLFSHIYKVSSTLFAKLHQGVETVLNILKMAGYIADKSCK